MTNERKPLYRQIVAMTGIRVYQGQRLEDLIIKHGGIYRAKVSQKVDFLIARTKDHVSRKTEKARTMQSNGFSDIKIITPDEFLSMLVEKKVENPVSLPCGPMANAIEDALEAFKAPGCVVAKQVGPTVTRYEVELEAGIRVQKVIRLAPDLALALKAESVRIIPNLPGKGTIGVEVPNATKGKVSLTDIMDFTDGSRLALPFPLGKNAVGKPIIADLATMPHVLIAGSTGSGKSVCINTLLVSLLKTKTPGQVKLVLIDPKRVELAPYRGSPHLLEDVVTDMSIAGDTLESLVDTMEERYTLLAAAGARNMETYNAIPTLASLPYIVVVVDEFSDLMMSEGKSVERNIIRLAQKSRAVGIHLVLATQRPSSEVFTGLIKSNMPTRISFRVTSGMESRIILDAMGAEKLLGKGDMLYSHPGSRNIVRCQGAFVTDAEISRIVAESVREYPKPEKVDVQPLPFEVKPEKPVENLQGMNPTQVVCLALGIVLVSVLGLWAMRAVSKMAPLLGIIAIGAVFTFFLGKGK